MTYTKRKPFQKYNKPQAQGYEVDDKNDPVINDTPIPETQKDNPTYNR